MLDSFGELTPWHAVPIAVLLWLAFFFGRTLRRGSVPLIEQIARLSEQELPAPICRYTRRLTAIWCGYFVASALVSLVARLPFGWTSALISSGAVLLFVSEHRLRRRFFPDRKFPGLVQQLRDTWIVWRKSP